jgi:Tol biopolymer transport system component
MFSTGKTDMPATAIFYPDQNLRQITTDPAPDYHVKWSPDGKMLAFASWRSGEPKI